jgi:quercetin dioxygenase-like cupin family protein
MRAAAALALLALVACGGGGGAAAGGAGAGGKPAGHAAKTSDADVARAIETAINRFGPEVHRCWRRGAADDFRLAGRVTLGLTIGAGGATAAVAIAEDTTGDAVLTACLAEVWRAATWPPASFAAGDAIQVPLQFVAPDGQYVVASADVPMITFGAKGESKAQVLLDAAATGNPAASLSLVSFEPGYATGLHQHEAAEVIYVLAGDGELAGGRPTDRPRPLTAGDAVYVRPGEPHAMRNDGGGPLLFVMAYGPAGAEQGLEGGVAAGTRAVEVGHRPIPSRGGPRLVKTQAVAPLAIASGEGEVRILFDRAASGHEGMSLQTMSGQGGMAVPPHVHDGASEYLLILDGKGVMTVAGVEHPIAAGDAIQIPPGVEHGVVIDDGSVLKALQLYTPAGPEQRFRGAGKPTP